MRSSEATPTGLELDLWIVAKPLVRIRAIAMLKAIVDYLSVNEIGYGRLSARVGAR